MTPTLIIHIGWHKTASSFIQTYLDRYREGLKNYGICYPFVDDRSVFSEIKHSYLYLSIINKLQLPHPQQDMQVLDFDELVSLSINEIADSGCRWAIISEEGLSEATPGIPRLMGKYKGYFDDIKIVGYVRRQDYFLESLYSQFVKQKPYKSQLYLDEYIQLPKVRKRGEYGTILDWWADEFGEENVLVAPFERQVMDPDPLTFFFKLTGLPIDALSEFPVEKKEVHVTPPREVIEYFRHMNINRSDYFVQVLSEYLMKSGALLTNTKYFSRAEREEILQRYNESNKTVAKRYLKREDGILFKEPVKDYENCLETWKGYRPIDLLPYALPITGKMSMAIGVLRHEKAQLESKLARLKKENLKLNRKNLALCRENQRLSSISRYLYRLLQKIYRKLHNLITKG